MADKDSTVRVQWKRLLSTCLFTVEQREYARPGRGAVRRDVVVHPGAVVVLPVLDDRRIVMIRNDRIAVLGIYTAHATATLT